MKVSVDHFKCTVYKQAETAEERERLAREARVLRVATHPGTVQLLSSGGSDPPEVLELRALTGGSVELLRYAQPEVAAGIGAALATVVADLHDLGVYHQAVRAEHVLLDEGGRPVLCGFGHAVLRPVSGRPRTAFPGAIRAGGDPFTGGDSSDDDRSEEDLRRRDVEDLIALVTALAGPDRGPQLARLMCPRLRRRPSSPRTVAHRLVRGCPGARLPLAPVQTVPVTRRSGFATIPSWSATGHRRVLLLAVGAASALVAVTAIGVAVGWHSGHVPTTATAPCPPVDRGCRPLSAVGGMIDVGGTRYLLGSPAGPAQVVTGRWGCRSALPAVLDTGPGTVWVFGTWPSPGSTASARLVRTVPAATGLSVLATRSGCDELEVQRSGRTPLVLQPRP